MTLPRLLAGLSPEAASISLAEHEAVHGPRGHREADLIEAAAIAGLRGRGGASFPTAVKLRSVSREPGPRTVLVNVAEGEPMSFKDRVLVACAPHLVLDGALSAAGAVGAERIVFALRDDAVAARVALRGAIEERRLGRQVKVRTVPVAYLAGQESALIHCLDGGPLKPRSVPPLPHQRGLRRRPTLVQNPETLAHLSLIDRHGAHWFRRLGTQEHTGSSLVTVSGAVVAPGVQEIACGARLDEVLQAAGGITEPLRAVLIGGFHGTWITGTEAGALLLDDDGLSGHGANLAAGVIVALGRSACPVQELARTVAWLARESAQQCGPCANGLPAIAALMAQVAAGNPPRDHRKLLARWSGQLPGRGACHLPDGAVRFLSTGLEVFAKEVSDHALHGPCDACDRRTTLVTAPDRTARRAA
jgi:NADH:ubiquinone oxidoreductase subunit F (NADH-binding)